MMQILSSQGVKFDDILICPHKPEDHCECRKPKVAMVKGYLEPGVIDVANSYVIGDRQTDIQLAANMGIQGLLYQRQALGWAGHHPTTDQTRSLCARLTA
ncbi:Histidine biosynthesis bifunctional protein hisB [Serratia fonticola]|uniref:Histidine biosynthesis bifunctional protein hisB n=1 Tax=Serratia fonticola TaxID=47917 RepID=A0A4U9TTP6_SERFO|nr:Histidine biosynthesis bifunctional protein hisB [Serratia fonticola]